MQKRTVPLLLLVALACLGMGLVDALWQPGYVIKSALKLLLFLLLPVGYSLWNRELSLRSLFRPEKKGLGLAVGMGAGVYVVVLLAFLLFREVFDFSALTGSLTSATGVHRGNFLWVALYISFVNSLLEEFFFRGFAFLALKQIAPRTFAYLFSAGMFAVYHIAMMLGWFAWPVVCLALLGLFVGGLIFNYFNEKYNNIYLSWLIHMFANFATNTIGFLLFQA